MLWLLALPLWIKLIILTILAGALCYVSAIRDAKKNREHWKNPGIFEPVLGATWHSFLSVPIYRLLRLVCVDMLTEDFLFVAGSGALLWYKLVELAAKGWVLGTVLLAIHLLAWVNWALPEHRNQFVSAFVNLINAFADKIRNGSSKVTTVTAEVSKAETSSKGVVS